MGVQVTSAGRLPLRLWDADASLALARETRDAVDERTFDLGQDVGDAPFRPYSAGYVADLAAAGESVRVDLNRTGALRAAVRNSIVAASAQRIVLGIVGDEGAVARQVSVDRPFFALSPNDVRRLQHIVPLLVRASMARSMEAP